MNTDLCTKAIDACISTILNYSTIESVFKAKSCSSKLFKKTVQRDCAFFNYLILELISTSDSAQLLSVKKGLSAFILEQQNASCSFNFWSKNSKDSKKYPYPDDLDDTFCALSALQRYDSNLISGETLKKVLDLLIAQEVDEGGPYKTWLITENWPEIWQDDIDVAVNANVAYFLKLNDVNLPKIDRLFEQKIEKKQLLSPLYYYSEWPVIYFVSRSCGSKMKDKLINLIRERLAKDKLDPLQSALAYNSLLNLNYDLKEYSRKITALAKTFVSLGCKPYPFVIERVRNKKVYYLGSNVLTAAFALNFFQKFLEKQNLLEKASIDQKIKVSVHSAALDRFKKTVKNSGLNQEFENFLNKITQTKLEKLTTLTPYHFQKMLGKTLSHKFIVNISVAHLYGWIAYTIYDDFLDNEGKPEMLSIANICHRIFFQIFSSVDDKNFQELFLKILNKADVINFEEVTSRNKKAIIEVENCAFKSMGHAIAPLAILFESQAATKKNVQHTLNYFQNYLAARQLCDDMHDWEEDLLKNERNFVTNSFLSIYKGKITKEMTLEARKIYWVELMPTLINQGKKMLFEAKKNIYQLNSDKNEFLDNALELEKVYLEAEGQRAKTLEYLKAINL